jgi:hypothetical protein
LESPGRNISGGIRRSGRRRSSHLTKQTGSAPSHHHQPAGGSRSDPQGRHRQVNSSPASAAPWYDEQGNPTHSLRGGIVFSEP